MSFFVSIHFKPNFRNTMGTSDEASVIECGCIPPIPARCACSTHYGQQRVCLVGSVSRYGVAWGIEKTTDQKIARRAGLRPLGAAIFSIQTTANRKMVFTMGGILGIACDHGGTCRGGILASFGAANWSTKNRRIKSVMARWPPNDK